MERFFLLAKRNVPPVAGGSASGGPNLKGHQWVDSMYDVGKAPRSKVGGQSDEVVRCILRGFGAG
jgi:hypothetical protein